MNKREFLKALGEELSGLPEEEITERLAFYGEMIDDRMEEGLTEEQAVAGIGDVREIAGQIASEIPLPRFVRERLGRRGRPKKGEIALLALGAPLWIPLLIACLAVAVSLFAVLWAVIASLWAAVPSLAAGAAASAAAGISCLFRGDGAQGILLIGAGLAAAGLAVFGWFGMKALTKAAWRLMKRACRGMRRMTTGKERGR